MRARLRRMARTLLLTLAIPCAAITVVLMVIHNHIGDPNDEQEALQ